jgi:hypothetical protein
MNEETKTIARLLRTQDNHGKMRVSAISLHRNREMWLIRDHLLSFVD